MRLLSRSFYRSINQAITKGVSALLLMLIVFALILAEGLLTGTADSVAFADDDSSFQVTFVDESGNTDKKELISGFDLLSSPSAGEAGSEEIPSDSPSPSAGVPSGAPAYVGHTFMRAFIGDPTDEKKQMEISAARRSGDKVVITPDTQLAGDAQTTLFYTLSQSDQIYVQYFEDSAYAEITYNDKTNGKVVVSGADIVGLTSGSGAISFIVSADRDYDIAVSGSVGSPLLSSSKDFSSATRTIIQYTYMVTTHTTFDISVSSKTNTKHKITFNTNKKNDWAHDGIAADAPRCKWNNKPYAHCSHIYRVNNTNYSVGSGPQTIEVDDNSKLEFTVYHDRDYYSLAAINTQLAGIYVGGQIFPAPQPLSRYGATMYDTYRSWIDAPKYNNINSVSGRAHDYAFVNETASRLKWLVPVHAKIQGYDPHWDSDHNKSGGSFQKWYTNAIMQRVIGAKTRREVKTGSLAGSIVTIEVIDAKPLTYTGELGASGSSSTVDNTLSNYENSDGNKMSGRGNTLRLAYKVTIENIRSNLDIDTEWVRSDTVKVGVYLNHGVQNLNVWASGTEGNAYSCDNNNNNWVNIGSNGSWFNLCRFSDTTRITNWNRGFNPISNDDPLFKFEATLQNGYTQPRYRDGSWSDSHSGEYVRLQPNSFTTYAGMKFDPLLTIPISDNKLAGSYPLFAATNIDIVNGGWNQGAVVFIGGMNMVGITSTPANVVGYFDLNGGTVNLGVAGSSGGTTRSANGAASASSTTAATATVESLFPTEAQATGNPRFNYNVESNTVITIPVEKPTKNGKPIISWDLYRVGPASSGSTSSSARSARTSRSLADLSEAAEAIATASTANLVSATAADTTGTFVASYLPGTQLDLTSVADMGSRITSETGDVLINKFYFKANYEKSTDTVLQSRTITLKAGERTLRSSSFSALTGASATISEDAVPETIVDSDKLYVRRIAKRELNAYLTAVVSDADETFVFEYDESPDIVPVTEPETDPSPYQETYWKVTFRAGSGGAVSGTTAFRVKKTASKTIQDLLDYGSNGDKVTATASFGYKFKDWNPAATTSITSNMTVTANFELDKPIIPKDTTNDSNPGYSYITVTFTAGTGGTLTGTTEYFVKKEADKKLNDPAIVKPTTNPNPGYKFDKWDKDDNTVLNNDLTVTASFVPDKDIIPKGENGFNDPPANYATVTFTVDSNKGSFDSNSQTVFYVNKNASKTVTDLTKPTVVPKLGYDWKNSWSVGDEHVITDDVTITANLDPFPQIDTVPHTGYVKVEFKPGDNGSFGTSDTTVFYVNPTAGVTFAAIIGKPTVTANTGYQFDNKWSNSDGAVNDSTPINKEMTITAQYTKLPDISTTNYPGYVTVTFAVPADKAAFASGATTTYYVNPAAAKKVGELTKPTVEPKTGFSWSNKWEVTDPAEAVEESDEEAVEDSEEEDAEEEGAEESADSAASSVDEMLITSNMTITAVLDPLPDIDTTSHPDYVAVTFVVPSDKASFKSGDTTVWYVNPLKAKKVSDLTKPGVVPKTGFDFKNVWSEVASGSTVDALTEESAAVDENKVISEALTLGAVLVAFDDVDSVSHPGYVRVTLSAGAHGEFNHLNGGGAAPQTVFWVNPLKSVTFTGLVPRPTPHGNTGYQWDNGWVSTPDMAAEARMPAAGEAVASGGDTSGSGDASGSGDSSGSDDASGSGDAAPSGDVSSSGDVSGESSPTSDSSSGSSSAASSPSPVTDETVIASPLIITATYTKLDDVVESNEAGDNKPDNYVTVRFAAGVHGRLQEGDVTTYFVNPFASVMFADLAEPGVVADGGYQFTHWVTVLRKAGSAAVSGAGGAVGGSADFDLADALDDSVDDAEAEPVWLGLSGNERITSDLMVVASFEGLPAVIPVTDPDLKRPSGYVTVEFTAGSHGSFEEGTLTRFFVNPDAGVLVENLPEAFVEADDGYRFTHWAVYYAKTTAAAEAGAESDSSDADDDTSGTSDSGSADSSSSSSDSSGLSDDSDGDSYADSVSSTGDGSAFSLVGLSGNEVVDDHVTLVAQYEALPNVIVVEDGLERPNGYVTVRFESGLHGSLSGMSEFYVKLAARLRVSDLAEPFVEPQTGFVFANWTRGDAEFDLDTVIGEDLVLVAAYTALPDVIPVLPGEGGDLPVRPAGYVTVTFVAGEHGVLAEGAPSKFFVNPTVNVTFSALSGKAPEVLPSTGFLFAAWTDEGKTVEPTLVINADKTFVASYSSIEDVVELTGDVDKPEGYVTVTFVVDPARATATGTLLYAVNPTKNVMLAKVPHPTVNAKTGFVHSGWDKADDFTVTADVTVNATFTQLDPVIPASDTTPNPPAGYVTVTFVVDPLLGDVAEGFQLVYFVDPTREVSLADLTKPEVSPLVDYRFLGWDKDDALRLVEDTTVTALFELTDAGEFEPEGQPIRVTEGTTPKAEDGVANRGELPEESVYSFKGELPVLPGSYEVTVVVTYPDGTVDEVEVTLIIDPAPKLTRIAKTGVASLPLMAAGVLFALVAGVFLTLRRNHEQ